MATSIDQRVTNSSNFYEKHPSFTNFSEVTNPIHYTPLPDNWIVVMADIEGSTKAIGEGRYKDVNMMGAGCIAAILNVTRGYEIPYVFGGDGATLAIPKEALRRVKDALLGAQDISRIQFDLNLRIGAVPIEDIRDSGLDVLVAKYQLSKGNYLAMFTGGGIEQVDQLIKNGPPAKKYRFLAKDTIHKNADLSGLSCRWDPLKSRNGQILSLLVQAQPGHKQSLQAIYDKVIVGINEILGIDVKSAKPVHQDNMHFSWPPKGLRSEIMATGRSAFSLYKESFIQWVLEKLNLSAGGYNAPIYRQELHANSDYQRFDDMLRLVLDCTEKQINEIDAFLSALNHKEEVIYGIHTADSALMTCLVFNLSQSEHVHFIDGADGGFALAATQLKAQLKILKK